MPHMAQSIVKSVAPHMINARPYKSKDLVVCFSITLTVFHISKKKNQVLGDDLLADF